MGDQTLKTKIQFRRDSAENWETNKDVVPASGEPCFDETNGVLKLGDGVTTYENLKPIGGTNASHYEGVKTGEESDMDVISRVLEAAGATPNKDDIFIVKSEFTTGKFSYTAYVYNGDAWAAMDGNYSAENVYFPSDMIFTYDFGKYKVQNGQVSVPSNGKNIMQFFLDAQSEEKNPSVSQPSVSVTANNMKSYEVGTKLQPSYTAKLNPGSYEFGPATGITATSWSVTLDGETLEADNGTFKEITVTDDTNMRISATAQHNDGAIPLTNLKNEAPDLKIVSGSKTGQSGALTGYRQMFYGKNDQTAAIDSATVRSLTASGKAAAAGKINIDASAGSKRFIIAIPTASGLKITSAIITSSLGADATSLYVKQEPVQVEGANGYTAASYDVYVYQPASIDATEKHEITIGR